MMNNENYQCLFIISQSFSFDKFKKAVASSKSSSAVVIVFNDNINLLKQVKVILSDKYKKTEFVYAAGKLEDLAYSVRKKFIKLVAGAKDIDLGKNKKLNEYLVYENKLSMWWLNEIFHKRSYKFKTFTYLCQIEFTEQCLDNIKNINECFILSNDRTFSSVMTEFMHQKSIRVKNILLSNLFRFTYLSFYLRLFKYWLVFIKWFIEYLLITIICKLQINQKILKNKISFIQFYTAFWPKTNFFRDDKFGKENKIVHAFDENEVISICTLFPDAIHTSIQFFDVFRILNEKKNKPYDDKKIFLLEKYISFSKIFNLFFYSFYLIFKLSKLSTNKNFKNYWVYKNVNIFPFIKTELNQSYRRTPRYLFYIERLKEFSRVFKPKAIIYNMFEAPIGKSTVYAIKSNTPFVKVIGSQDGPLCRLKLETASHPSEFSNESGSQNYIDLMPVPDQILLEGEYARTVLNESGYPSKILNICGSARMIGLKEYEVSRLFNDKKRILIAFGGNDNYSIINLMLEIVKMKKNYYFIFKNHPRGIMNSLELNNYLIKVGFRKEDYEINSKPAWELFRESNFVLGTFTSVLDEAATKGLKVISLLFAERINTSILVDLELPWVKTASSALDVCRIIDEDNFLMPNQEELAKVINHLYNYTSNDTVTSWRDKIYKIVR